MKIIKNNFLIAITILFVACSDDDYTKDVPEQKQTQLKVIGRGTAVAQLKTITNPDNGQPVEAFCFLMDLIDSKTGEIIGTLEDCDMGTTENPDGTLVSKIVTKFNFTGKGSFTSRGDVLQTPIGDGKFTTESNPSENNVFDTTFDFEGSEGKATLVGEIDLSKFDQNIIGFDCNFTIDLVSY
ncbi:hypothetical protein [Ulvibacterium marinum]|uniref:Uncharacterized protein n=1 Tax=Ulvibacterium marinum TaxID=2419782 RepID=A0A3B0CGL4_9FLAO|nr:hypothetical protein [Ulvibacterium marinum]RKN83519.1 hypothetical protein D7Z94_06790 [Ulvibacterium marinum]